MEEALKVRLNMVNIYGNYKKDLSKKRFCPHCSNERDTTEHLIRCSAFEYEERWEGKDLIRTDVDSLRGMLNIVKRNMEARWM